MEILKEAPQISSFVPVIAHQSTTPESFHSGPPVLHYYSDRCKVIVLEDELQFAPALLNLVSKASGSASSDETETNEAANGNGTHVAQKTLEDVDVWVTSDKLLLYSKRHEAGIAIPYPTICIHAIQSSPEPLATEPQSQSLYMQLMPSMPSSDDEEPPETVSVTIVPTASAPPPPTEPETNEDEAIASEDKPELTPVQALYQALSDCSDLHPDPAEDDEEQGSRLMQAGLAIPGTSDGSMPPPMPGSGGWITAENMHEFIDEDGNFIEQADEEMDDLPEEHPQDLGPGAGNVRPRRDGEEADASETKWQRTS